MSEEVLRGAVCAVSIVCDDVICESRDRFGMANVEGKMYRKERLSISFRRVRGGDVSGGSGRPVAWWLTIEERLWEVEELAAGEERRTYNAEARRLSTKGSVETLDDGDYRGSRGRTRCVS
ncbi:hypothetical protein PIB30_011261 [Stylosanthes scabra]|uniref:Uncharacterized protein n=1 Tax=Stylosanthes scabra TaxID=79078 RepID=A0ABU6U4I6_9FABA|nr:hypothetical protein [Stylosanthes scabra]